MQLEQLTHYLTGQQMETARLRPQAVRTVNGGELRLIVVVPDEQAYADKSQQKLEGYNENVYHNS